jgi:Amt family ammonium transporter
MAITVTHISASVGTLVWMGIEWFKNGKPSVLGAATGSIAGLAAITPASGSVGPLGALAIGLTSGLLCYFASVNLKAKFGYDDSLDVFGVHGVGGVVGTLLVAVFAADTLGGSLVDHDMAAQLGVQSLAIVGTVVYTVAFSVLILVVVRTLFGGLRVSEQQERDGLDITEHEERGYDL